MREAIAGSGLEIKRVSEATFREFAERHGTSPEIGRIKTRLDADDHDPFVGTLHLRGLLGCGKLCGVSCCTLTQARDGDSYALKLDSLIVDARLRRRGLATALVARQFLDVVTNPDLEISSVYAHSVHPATVRLLHRLSFSAPPPMGAPISALRLDSKSRKGLIAACKERVDRVATLLKLHCVYCMNGDRRARRWCLARGEKVGHLHRTRRPELEPFLRATEAGPGPTSAPAPGDGRTARVPASSVRHRANSPPWPGMAPCAPGSGVVTSLRTLRGRWR